MAGANYVTVTIPSHPSPTHCGNNLNIPAGPCDQRPIEARDDTLVFETPVLPSALAIVGPVRARLFVSIDQPDADLMVRMTDVYPDGRSMLITDAALRLAWQADDRAIEAIATGAVSERIVELGHTAIALARGHKLRISVTSSNYPRYAVNHNNGRPFPESSQAELGTPVRVTLHHSSQHPSALQLRQVTLH